jgi:hypothetical protein
MRRVLGVPTVLSVVILMAASTSTATAASITPAGFTQQVCAAIATGTQSLKANLSTFQAAAAAYKASPSPTTATAVRDAYTQAYQDVGQQMAAVLAVVDQAGTPSGGAAFVAALKNALQAQQAAAQQFGQQAAAIDTSSPSTFEAAFQQVANDAKAQGKKMRKAVKAAAAIKHAVRAYHPLVRVLTTDADTCPKS